MTTTTYPTTRKRKAFVKPSGDTDASKNAAGISVSEFYSQIIGHDTKNGNTILSPNTPFCSTCQEHISDMSLEQHKTTSLHLFNCQHKPNPIMLPESNKGYKMLRDKMGWNENEGLGVKGEGIRVPVSAVQKKDRKGIGNKSAAVVKNPKRMKITHTTEDAMSRRERKAQEVQEKAKEFAIRDAIYNDFEYLNM